MDNSTANAILAVPKINGMLKDIILAYLVSLDQKIKCLKGIDSSLFDSQKNCQM